MKNRNGFVSNSSSSSFVIKKKNLTPKQIEQIKNYKEEAWKLGEYDKIVPECSTLGTEGKFGWIDNFWVVTESVDEIEGNTIMDNFRFEVFLEEIGVKEEDIIWEEI